VFDSHSSQPVGSVRPTEDERKWPNHRGSLHDRKEREIHRESAFRRNETKNKTALKTASRRNETKNKTVLRTSAENRHGKRCRWWPLDKRSHLAPISCSATLGNKTKKLARQSIVLSRTRQRDKRSHQRAGNKDAERCSPNDRKRCRFRDRSQNLTDDVLFTPNLPMVIANRLISNSIDAWSKMVRDTQSEESTSFICF
jgi:hypothetical protein